MTPNEKQRLKNRLRIGLRRVLRATGTNHVAAVALLRFHDALQSESLWPRGALQALKETLDAIPGQLFRLAGFLDDKAPCPYCGKPEALVHLATLKTYCWDCSYWGHDPRILDSPTDSAQT